MYTSEFLGALFGCLEMGHGRPNVDRKENSGTVQRQSERERVESGVKLITGRLDKKLPNWIKRQVHNIWHSVEWNG